MEKESNGSQRTGKAVRQSMLTRQGVGMAGTDEAVREMSSRGLPVLLMVADGVDTSVKEHIYAELMSGSCVTMCRIWFGRLRKPGTVSASHG